MHTRFILSLLSVLLLASCATNSERSAGAEQPITGRIGVLVLTDERPVHYHLGATMFGDSTRPLDSDWELENWADWKLTQLLAGRGSVVRLRLGRAQDGLRSILKSTWRGRKIDEQLRPILQDLIELQSLDAIVTLEPISEPLESEVDADANGFGIYTRCIGQFFCKAYLLDHVAIRVFSAHPLEYVNESLNSEPKQALSLLGEAGEEGEDSESVDVSAGDTNEEETDANPIVAMLDEQFGDADFRMNFSPNRPIEQRIDEEQAQDTLYRVLGERLAQLLGLQANQ